MNSNNDRVNSGNNYTGINYSCYDNNHVKYQPKNKGKHKQQTLLDPSQFPPLGSSHASLKGKVSDQKYSQQEQTPQQKEELYQQTTQIEEMASNVLLKNQKEFKQEHLQQVQGQFQQLLITQNQFNEREEDQLNRQLSGVSTAYSHLLEAQDPGESKWASDLTASVQKECEKWLEQMISTLAVLNGRLETWNAKYDSEGSRLEQAGVKEEYLEQDKINQEDYKRLRIKCERGMSLFEQRIGALQKALNSQNERKREIEQEQHLLNSILRGNTTVLLFQDRYGVDYRLDETHHMLSKKEQEFGVFPSNFSLSSPSSPSQKGDSLLNSLEELNFRIALLKEDIMFVSGAAHISPELVSYYTVEQRNTQNEINNEWQKLDLSLHTRLEELEKKSAATLLSDSEEVMGWRSEINELNVRKEQFLVRVKQVEDRLKKREKLQQPGSQSFVPCSSVYKGAYSLLHDILKLKETVLLRIQWEMKNPLPLLPHQQLQEKMQRQEIYAQLRSKLNGLKERKENFEKEDMVKWKDLEMVTQEIDKYTKNTNDILLFSKKINFELKKAEELLKNRVKWQEGKKSAWWRPSFL